MEDYLSIRKIKSNNADLVNEGFEEIYNKYSKLIYLCVVNIIKNNEDAKDITSDVFLNFFNKRRELDEVKNIKYYLVTAAKNSSLNYIKQKRVDYLDSDDVMFESLETPSSELKEMIDTLKKYLDEYELKIVLEHLLYEMTFEEISEELNTSVNTVKTKYYRAIKKVRYE